MVSKKSREQLIIEFAQSHRLTGQLFFKFLQATVQEKEICNMACLPILKTLKQEGSLPQHAIARALHHSDAAVSRQIGILTADGLVTTRVDNQNRRVTLVELTGEGDKVLETLEGAVIDKLTDLLAALPDEKLQHYIAINTELQTIITPHAKKEPNATSI